MDGNLALNAHFENLPEEAMNTSPINGLNYEQFEKMREQIIEYIKMYSTDGEAIGSYKIMKLFEQYLTKCADDICHHPYLECILSDQINIHGNPCIKCSVCGNNNVLNENLK